MRYDSYRPPDPVKKNRITLRFWETAHLPSPRPLSQHFGEAPEVSAYVGLGKGQVGSFPETYTDPKNTQYVAFILQVVKIANLQGTP